jgi:hypothetical protein
MTHQQDDPEPSLHQGQKLTSRFSSQIDPDQQLQPESDRFSVEAAKARFRRPEGSQDSSPGSSPGFDSPRFSAIRRQRNPVSPDTPLGTLQEHTSGAGQKLTQSETGQLLTSPDQQIGQKLTFQRFSSVRPTAPKEINENKFSTNHPAPKPVPEHQPSASPATIQTKPYVALPRPEFMPVREKHRGSRSRSR